MTPLVLTVLACLASAPDECREHVVPFDETMPVDPRLPMQCFLAANAWAAEHPGWRVRHIRCGPMEWRL